MCHGLRTNAGSARQLPRWRNDCDHSTGVLSSERASPRAVLVPRFVWSTGDRGVSCRCKGWVTLCERAEYAKKLSGLYARMPRKGGWDGRVVGRDQREELYIRRADDACQDV